ncbi:glutamine amidotransferase [Variovorax boronicumulans]|uniref:glutamine amidotransferase n=1 Tax=Variovorax boronicumulans TaxID=436515 RepID=UPI000785155D|nr:glutamine amidotransferase [Variovorax boronicumulans]
MPCIALQHLAFEDLGRFANVLTQAGHAIDYRQAGPSALSDDEWRHADLVVVLGGPIGAYDTATYPWLAEAIAGLRERLALQRPTLGLCLGAQLMARALGARVYPSGHTEIGWAPVDLSAAGQASCLATLDGEPVLHWHGDTFDLPPGAELLASTARTPHLAFSHGRHALALQFHPEADPARIEPWLIGHHHELAASGVDIPALRARSAELANKRSDAATRMLAAWLDQLA